MGRVLPDTNVLFPFSVMDLLLALSEEGVHEVVWTDALLDEWQDVIVREQRRSPDTAASITAAIRAFFSDSKVERAEYAHLVGEMPGPDPDDHKQMAAAVARQRARSSPGTRRTSRADHWQREASRWPTRTPISAHSSTPCPPR
jgi:hypothetical protein